MTLCADCYTLPNVFPPVVVTAVTLPDASGLTTCLDLDSFEILLFIVASLAEASMYEDSEGVSLDSRGYKN